MRALSVLSVYLALTTLTLVVFALWPGLDLIVAHLFYGGGGFIGQDRLARWGRDFFRVTPFAVIALYAALWLAKRLNAYPRWAPTGRAMVFLIATLVIGPGLIVNLGLKDHWHRPRPVQTQEFNGPNPFRPWYEGDGACKRNCSFVSGEAATGFWMVAPASVLPSPWQGPAILAAFAFGIGASLLRMAFGGHYLSDVLLGGLVTLVVIEIARLIVWPTALDRLLETAPEDEGDQTAADVVHAALAPPNHRAPSVSRDLAYWVARVAGASISPARRKAGR